MEEGGGGMSKNPSFQFYPGDWLSSQRVSLLTLEEEGAYIRLLCYCWQHGNIPSDSVQLARLIGKGATVELAETVAMMFQPKRVKGGSALVHDRLDVMKEERAAWLEKSRLGGIRSGQARKKANETGEIEAKGGSSLVEDCLEPKGNTSTSTSTSINPPPLVRTQPKKKCWLLLTRLVWWRGRQRIGGWTWSQKVGLREKPKSEIGRLASPESENTGKRTEGQWLIPAETGRHLQGDQPRCPFGKGLRFCGRT